MEGGTGTTVEMEEDSGECPQPTLATSETRSWSERLRNGWVVRETVAIIKIAAPMVANNFFYQIMFTVALVIVGNSSGRSLELDAAALALSFMNVTGVSVGIGLSTAAETLCAQMYGFKNYKGLGVVTQRGIWILGLALFPILIIWFNTESILLLIQQDPCVARLTSLYVKIFSSALPALYLFFMLQRYLVAQSVVMLFIWIGVINNVVSAALHGIFIYGIGMGVEGSSVSLALSTLASPLILLVFIRFRRPPHQTWGGWSLDGLRGWGQFVRLGVPGLLMVCFEWWCFELAAFVTGSISNTQLAIHTIILQALTLNFMVPYGVSMALTVRVGNELGAGNPQRAKQATYTAFGITLIESVLVMVFLASTRNILGRIFTRDKEVIEGVGQVILVILPTIFSDSFQGMMQGVLRGTGKQMSGAVVNFVSYYIIGFPVGTTLAIVAGMGALGMWIGLLLASFAQMTCYFVMVACLNWDKESLKAIERAQNTSDSTDTSTNTKSESSSISTIEEAEGEAEGEAKGEEEVKGEGEGEGEGKGEGERLIFKDFTATKGIETEKKKKQESDSGDLIEELPLISMDEEEEEESAELSPQTTAQDSNTSNGKIHKLKIPVIHRVFPRGRRERIKSTNIRLVLSRLALLVVGVVLLVLGGLASQYRPHRPLSDYCPCSDPPGNGTEVWACQNETATTAEDPVFGTGTLSPSPSTLIYPGTSFVMTPTLTPLP